MSRPLSAVVFDVDGTVADTERLSDEAWAEVLAPYGVVPTAEDRSTVLGRSFAATRDHYAARAPALPAADVLWASYGPLILRLVRQRARAFPDAAVTVGALQEWRVPLAFASSSPRARLDATLLAVGLAQCGPSVAGDEVAIPKPDPGMYRVAAALLGRPPDQCIAVEDTTVGVAAARAAGMFVIEVRRSASDGETEADLLLPRLDPGALRGLLGGAIYDPRPVPPRRPARTFVDRRTTRSP